jgi:pyruvate/2-oxoglutarate/acetoin dehydrogenase E1 component/TPP-dependent pyruvate/acetoin dehydrogenase alpha subunit
LPRAELRRVQPARAPLPEPATLRALYRAMLRIRRVEEVIAERYRAGEMRCPVHLSIGQEAAAVGACAALLPEDRIVSTHRCHGHYLAKGGDLPAMIAELHGKATGCCGGRGGSMHLFDDAAGVVASVPIVGSSVPLGVGLALAFKQRGEARVAMTFLGDAAVEEGAFHEAANFAAVQGLPVVFFVENNLYSVYTRLDARQPARPLAKLGEAHGLETFVVYGNDVLAVREVTTQAVAAARAGRPALVVAETYRTREHCGPSDDDELGYRPVGELSQWLERCPLARMRDTLAEVASEADLDEVLDEARARAAIDTEIAAAFAAAAAAPFPAPETATAYVYAPVPPAPALPDAGARELSAEQAIAEATVQAMAADPAVIVMGEGVTDPKGIFGTTLGLAARFPGRVLEMPVAENGFTGAAIGAALQGLRPIVVHQRVEFALLAFEQLANNAAKMHYVSGGKHRVPLVVRLVVGRGWGQGPAHSQSLEALFAHIPGLKVVMPATPADCKGLLLGAIAEDNPVLFIEHRWVHYGRGLVPTEPVALPLDGPRRLRAGDAVTVVATSYMTLEALHAAEALARHGCMVDLIDLRVVAPLQLDLVFDSIARTGRLLTVDTGFATLGPGAEIAAQVSERCFHRLVAPPQRLGLPAHPTPSARTLAARYYPRSPQIAEAAARLCGLPERAVQAVRDELQAVRDALPVDVPHPAFRGPF